MQLSLSLYFQVFCSLGSLYKCTYECIPKVNSSSLEILFQFSSYFVVPIDPHHSASLPEAMYQDTSLSVGASGSASASMKLAVRGVVQDWSQPLTCFLWCLLVGEKQTSLLRGELTSLLWIKGNGSLNIEGKKKHMVEGFDYLQRSLREWGVWF